VDKRDLSERDICTKFIAPAIERAGWDQTQVREEVSFTKKRLAITTSGLYSLSVGKIRGIAVPVPDEESTRVILARVEHLMKLCDDLEAKLAAKEETASKLVEAVVKALVA